MSYSQSYPGADHAENINYSYDTYGTSADRTHKTNSIQDQIRLNFVRKVFSITAVQLLCTAFVTWLSITNMKFNKFQAQHDGLMLLSVAAFIIPSLMLAWSDKFSRKVPVNYILLAILTIGESYMVAFMASQYDPKIVVTGLFLTGAVVGGLALYAMTTKTEVTYFGSLIVLASGSLFWMMIISMFVRIHLLESVIFIGTCISSGLYLIYDIKVIMGKEGTKLGLDDYIRGAMYLYVDIIRIFIKILQILQKLQDDKKDDDRRKRRN